MTPEPTSEHNSVCYRHPDRETRLGCGRCGRPICISCAHSTPVGHRCPDCLHELQSRHHTDGRYLNPLTAVNTQPVLTYALLAIIVVVFVLQEISGGSTNPQVLVRFGATYGPLIMEGEIWRLVSAMFLHIGLTHLMFNGFALYTIGRDVELFFGYERFAFIYFAAGIFGSLASFAIRGPMEFSAGASGAVFGLIGAELAFLVFHRDRLGDLGRVQRQRIIRLIIINLIIGFAIAVINNAAHIGGLIGGFVLGYLLAPRFMPELTVRGNEYVDHGSLARRWWVVLLTIAVLVGGTWGAIQGWTNYPAQMARLASPLSGLPFSSENETAEMPGIVETDTVRLDDQTECMVFRTEEAAASTLFCTGFLEEIDGEYRHELNLGRVIEGNRFHLALDMDVEEGRLQMGVVDRNGRLTAIDSARSSDGEEGVYAGVVGARFTLLFESTNGPARAVTYWLTLSGVE